MGTKGGRLKTVRPGFDLCPPPLFPFPSLSRRPQPALRGSGALPASTHAAASTVRAAARRMGRATAPQDGPVSSALSVSASQLCSGPSPRCPLQAAVGTATAEASGQGWSGQQVGSQMLRS